MPDLLESSDFVKAKREGRRSGYDPIEQTADCPYRFDRIQLRRQWLAGFSEGRRTYRQQLFFPDY